jgi:putative heme-binding domain-containing protein
LIALDQMKDGGLTAGEVAPLLESTDTTLRETAAWIVSHRTDWGADLAGAFRDRLRRLGPGEFERSELEGQLAHLARDGTIQGMMLEVLLEPATEQPTRELLLEAMADSKLASLPHAWGVGLSRFIPRAEGEDLGLAIAVVQALPAAKTNAIDLNQVMLQAAANPAREPAVRLRALAATRGEVVLNEAAFGFLCGQLRPEEPAMSKVTAAEVIGRARLSSEQSLEVTKLIRSAGALELPKLLAAFEKGGDADVGGALMKALEQSAALGSLRAEQLRLVVEKYPAPVQEAGQTLIARLDVNAAREKERLDELDASLPKGDRDRGRRVFESSNTACTTCHQVGYIGGRIGPDLTKIGAIRTTRDLLESILFPSASFVRSYEPMILTTRDGEEHAGVLREESGETVTVMTGPNNVVRLARSDVAEMRPGAVSVMPQGMEETLGAQELADLVDFLKSLK